MSLQEKVDWSECPLVEVKERVQSGSPVLRGTRMPADAIVDNFDYGVSVSEIAKQFELPLDRVEAIIAYARSGTRRAEMGTPFPISVCGPRL